MASTGVKEIGYILKRWESEDVIDVTDVNTDHENIEIGSKYKMKKMRKNTHIRFLLSPFFFYFSPLLQYICTIYYLTCPA